MGVSLTRPTILPSGLEDGNDVAVFNFLVLGGKIRLFAIFARNLQFCGLGGGDYCLPLLRPCTDCLFEASMYGKPFQQLCW
jgi:hypothetical protein